MIDYLFGEGVAFWASLQIVVTLLSLLLILRQIKSHGKEHLISSLNIVLTKWNSELLLKARRRVCENYTPEREDFDHACCIVAGFFEELGIYKKNEVIDEDILWEFFSDHVCCYWPILKNQIITARRQEKDNSFYTNFEQFYRDSLEVCKKKGLPHDAPTTARIKARIAGEIDNIHYLEVITPLENNE